MQNVPNKKILVTGGGSGGHLVSAQTLIQSMLNEYMMSPQSIVYVGGDLGMEEEKDGNSIEQKQMVDKEFKVYFIRAGKLQRRVSFNTVKLLFRSILGFVDSYRIFTKEKPDIVISTGGFVSVPVCIVSKCFGIPVYLHEQTAAVGLANKIVGKVANKIYISFKNSSKYFPKGKTIHTGNILRKNIFQKDETQKTDKDIIELFKQKLPILYISGGSLGSHIINMKVLSKLDSLLDKYSILLQTGDNRKLKDFELAEERKSKLDEEKRERFLPVKYVDSDSIGYVFNNMNLFIGRSGANTVYELGVLKKYAILIPIPWVTHNEQYLNAKVLEDLGTAKILEEKYLQDIDLVSEIEKFEEQVKLRDINTEKLEEIFPINATSKILNDII
jgi:UDP-N-acetylglucosamine--N-acetylmuramyl-(pentapeptide) pyrophosphoryl-undecaprenol N-acetylglucosamine transferase